MEKNELDLRGRGISRIDRSISQYSFLKTLILSGNKISKIENLEECQYLEKLDLSSNKLVRIEGLDALSRLSVLILKHNGIRRVEGLEALPNLSILDLSDNCITVVPSLHKNSRLKTLDLSNNNIVALPDLSRNRELMELFLGGNLIPSLKEVPARLPPTLFTLDLSNNEIKSFTDVKYLTPLSDSARLLNLSGNPFHEVLKQHGINYRPFVAFVLPLINILDEEKITPAERELCQTLFTSDKSGKLSDTLLGYLNEGFEQQLMNYLKKKCSIAPQHNQQMPAEHSSPNSIQSFDPIAALKQKRAREQTASNANSTAYQVHHIPPSQQASASSSPYHSPYQSASTSPSSRYQQPSFASNNNNNSQQMYSPEGSSTMQADYADFADMHPKPRARRVDSYPIISGYSPQQQQHDYHHHQPTAHRYSDVLSPKFDNFVQQGEGVHPPPAPARRSRALHHDEQMIINGAGVIEAGNYYSHHHHDQHQPLYNQAEAINRKLQVHQQQQDHFTPQHSEPAARRRLIDQQDQQLPSQEQRRSPLLDNDAPTGNGQHMQQQHKYEELQAQIEKMGQQMKEMRTLFTFIAKREHAKQTRAATKIQAVFRGYMTRKRTRSILPPKKDKARIQTADLLKKYLTLSSIHVSSQAIAPKLRNNIKQRAAQRIQALARGFLIRRRLATYLKYQKAATTIQALWRGFKVRRRLYMWQLQRRISTLDGQVRAYQIKCASLEMRLDAEVQQRRLQEDAMRYLWEEVKTLRMWILNAASPAQQQQQPQPTLRQSPEQQQLRPPVDNDDFNNSNNSVTYQHTRSRNSDDDRRIMSPTIDNSSAGLELEEIVYNIRDEGDDGEDDDDDDELGGFRQRQHLHNESQEEEEQDNDDDEMMNHAANNNNNKKKKNDLHHDNQAEYYNYTADEAAVMIQKVWRGYCDRKLYALVRQAFNEFQREHYYYNNNSNTEEELY